MITSEHKVIRNREYIRAKDLKKGDYILCADGKERKVVDIEWKTDNSGDINTKEKSMKMITELENGLVQVYAGSLPVGAISLHKGDFYEKTDEEHAKDMFGKECTFEPHYGSLISKKQFEHYGLTDKDVMDDSKDGFYEMIEEETEQNIKHIQSMVEEDDKR